MTLFCWDVDGVLDCKENDNEEYLKGIIKTKVLDDLINKGHKIAIVSPSPYFPEKYKDRWFNKYGSNDGRWINILEGMEELNETEHTTIYVDDLQGNINMVRKQFPSMELLLPDEFMMFYNVGKYDE